MPAIAAATNGALGTTRKVYFPKESKLSERPSKLLTFSHTRPLLRLLSSTRLVPQTANRDFPDFPFFGSFDVGHLPL